MAAVIAILIAASVLALGAVYPAAYLPLFGAAALIGIVGLVRRRRFTFDLSIVAGSLALVVVAAVLQLIPISPSTLESISPRAPKLLEEYSLAFATGDAPHPISIRPAATAVTVFAVTAFGLYMIGTAGMLSREAVRSFARNLLWFAVLMALFGILSRARNNGLVYWFWKPEEDGSNVFGPFVNRNHFAGWMLMASCLAIGSLFGQLERAFKNTAEDWRNRAIWMASREGSGLLLTAGAIVTMAVSLVWTLSRSGITSFTVALGCFALLVVRRRRTGSARRGFAMAALAAMLITAVSWRGTDVVLQWLGDTRTLESRVAAWQDGWRVVQDFRLAGTGLNTYGPAMLFYQRSNEGFYLDAAHNDYLQLLAEGGLLVTIPAALAVIALAVAIGRNLKAAQHEARGYWIRAGAAIGMAGIAVQETVEFSLQIPANAFLFCTLAAIALAPVERRA